MLISPEIGCEDPNSGNFMVIGIEGVKTPYIIDGKGLKSLLRKYLKKIAKLQSRG